MAFRMDTPGEPRVGRMEGDNRLNFGSARKLLDVGILVFLNFQIDSSERALSLKLA